MPVCRKIQTTFRHGWSVPGTICATPVPWPSPTWEVVTISPWLSVELLSLIPQQSTHCGLLNRNSIKWATLIIWLQQKVRDKLQQVAHLLTLFPTIHKAHVKNVMTYFPLAWKRAASGALRKLNTIKDKATHSIIIPSTAATTVTMQSTILQNVVQLCTQPTLTTPLPLASKNAARI